MLNIPRLRKVLKKLETSSDLAKFLIQRATAVAGTINKEYAANENSPNGTSSAGAATSQSKSQPPLTTMPTNTFTKQQSSSSSAENALIYNSEPKTITATIANVSLFSSTERSGGVAKALPVSQSQSNLRSKVSALKQNKNDNQPAVVKPNQRSDKMSKAELKEIDEVTRLQHQNQHGEDEPVCNGTSCDSGSDGSPKEKTCFKTGLGDILHFLELVGSLKHTKRTGWVLRDVNDCESISGHMYRMSMMTFLLDGSEGLNQIRCMELALVHDLAESLVGDLTPFCGVAKEDKKAMELKAMQDICKLIEPRGKRIMELFEEYEAGETAESKFVKDLDRLDMVMQAFEYEKRDDCLMKHQEFFDSTEGKFQHPFVKKLVKEITDQRKALSEAKIIANGNLKLKTVTPNCPPCLEHKNERS